MKDNYSLKIANGVCDLIDFRRFKEENKVINSDNLESAEYFIRLYQGELLMDMDKDWINEERNWLEMKMEELMLKTAVYNIKNMSHNRAEIILNKLIEINPLSINGYETLLNMYIEVNNKVEFQLLYSRYKQIMEQELLLEVNSNFTVYAGKV